MNCARCNGLLINGYKIIQYPDPVCETCKIYLCGKIIRTKPSATSITMQDTSNPVLFDLVREWRERARTLSYQDKSYERGVTSIYLRCAEELESHSEWKKIINSNALPPSSSAL